MPFTSRRGLCVVSLCHPHITPCHPVLPREGYLGSKGSLPAHRCPLGSSAPAGSGGWQSSSLPTWNWLRTWQKRFELKTLFPRWCVLFHPSENKTLALALFVLKGCCF